MELPKETFSLSKVKDLYENGLLKDRIDCKNYVGQYIKSGNHDVEKNEFEGKPAHVKFTSNTEFDRCVCGETYWTGNGKLKACPECRHNSQCIRMGI